MTVRAKDRPRLAALLAVSVLLIAAAPASAVRNLYVPSFSSNTLLTYTAGPGSSLAAVGGPIATDPQPESVVLTPDGKYLFLTSVIGNSIARFAPDASDGRPVSLGTNVTVTAPRGAAVTADGSKLYVSGDGVVTAYAIGADGSLALLGSASLGALQGRAIAVTPDATSLYVTAFDGTANDTLLHFTIGADGAPAGGTVSDTQPRDLAKLTMSPDGRFLYAADSGISDASARGIRGYAIGAGGALSALAGNPYANGGITYAIAASPAGGFLFGAEVSTNTVRSYAIGADGAPSAVGTPVPTGGTLTGSLPVAPSGRSLFAVNVFSDDISRYAVGADGIVSSAGTNTPAGTNPGDLAPVVSPDQGPTAALTATAAAAGTPTQLDASGSSDPDGTVARYDWDFGDGSALPDGGPSPTHTYQQPGGYTVTLTVTDDEACSTRRSYTGQTVACNGSAAAAETIALTIAAPVATPAPPAAQTPAAKPPAAPSACASRREFAARSLGLRHGERITRAVLLDGRHPARALKHTRRTVTVNLRGLPKKTFKLRITVRGAVRTRTLTRSYRTCQPR